MKNLNPKQLVLYRLLWAAFLVLVIVPVIAFGSQLTGVHMEERVLIYSSWMPLPLAYLYYFVDVLVPDATISFVHLSGILWPEFGVYFLSIFMLFVEPPYYRELKGLE